VNNRRRQRTSRARSLATHLLRYRDAAQREHFFSGSGGEFQHRRGADDVAQLRQVLTQLGVANSHGGRHVHVQQRQQP
jgi:hypothetical protein